MPSRQSISQGHPLKVEPRTMSLSMHQQLQDHGFIFCNHGRPSIKQPDYQRGCRHHHQYDALPNVGVDMYHVQVLAFLAAVEHVESEVAEVRQLKEEEQSLLLGMTAAMVELWKQLVEVRERQGGLRLTDVGFSVVQLPQEDCIPLQAVSGMAFTSCVG